MSSYVNLILEVNEKFKVWLRDIRKQLLNQPVKRKYSRFLDSTTDLSTQIQFLIIAQTFEAVSVRLGSMSGDEKEKQMHMLASMIRKEIF